MQNKRGFFYLFVSFVMQAHKGIPQNWTDPSIIYQGLNLKFRDFKKKNIEIRERLLYGRIQINEHRKMMKKNH